MKCIAVGVGPGDPDLITVKALKTIERAGLVLVPAAGEKRSGLAGAVLRAHLDVEALPIVFPMTRDEGLRDSALLRQLEELRPRWESVEEVALPVIGDSALYPTAAYLYGVWKTLRPDLELELVPGVSAHSLASSLSRRFLAMGEEIFSIIPGTADEKAIAQALKHCDAAALYKPSALGERLRAAVESAGPWEKILRADRAGLPDERILSGDDALSAPDTYFSTLLLWRGRAGWER